ncbi:hypothetical protein CcaverHIS002_0306750 [Cutaneotrichosporon cavernicola]|nr:hypothetical protein CcaverHIS002_0306750 [Cutaneotrichosporon cavernicola]
MAPPAPPAPPAPTYVSSSGQLTTPPLSKRVYDAISDYATIGYLFVETLVSPIVNPNTAPTSAEPGPASSYWARSRCAHRRRRGR